jgi:hypothetical protein
MKLCERLKDQAHLSHVQTDGSKLEKYVRDTLDPSLSWKVQQNWQPYAN